MHGGKWHDSLSASTGLTRQKTEYRATVEDNDFIERMFGMCKPHYDALAPTS